MKRPNTRRFRPTDSAQQVVGGFLLAGPFVVTEEVWMLAENMSVFQALATVALVFGIGYATLYKADPDRASEVEQKVAGVPLRFVSLMLVSFGSVSVLAFLFGAPEVFVEKAGVLETVFVTFKAVSVGSIFSVVGAATADSVF